VTALVKEMARVASEIESKDIRVSFQAYSPNGVIYWSFDVNYEIGLLGSMGLLRLDGDVVNKTSADYQEARGFLWADLDPEVKEVLQSVAT